MAEILNKENSSRKTSSVARLLGHLGFMVLLAFLSLFGTLMIKALIPAPTITYPLLGFNQGSDLYISEKPLDYPKDTSYQCVATSQNEWEVAFENNSSKLDQCQQNLLRKIAAALATCNIVGIDLRGFVSSAGYASDSDRQHLELANQRAEKVAAFLRPLVPKATIKVIKHSSVDEISASIRFYDKRSEPKSEHPAEFLNRKVIISLSSDTKCSFLKSTGR